MSTHKILFVSHCVLNTAAKVARQTNDASASENSLRKELLRRALEADVQLVQLPCPELTLYGPSRWGHTREQFDHPFFRAHCRQLLAPILAQMQAYLHPREAARFRVLGIVGVEGSPSCGVGHSCSGPWGGEFAGRSNLAETLAAVSCPQGQGVFIEELQALLAEAGLALPLVGLDAKNPTPLWALLER